PTWRSSRPTRAPTPSSRSSSAATSSAFRPFRGGPDMDRRFTGRTAIVTGAARGIGAATAARLASEGAAVVVVDLDEAAAAERAALIAADAEVRAAGGTAEAAAVDMTDAEAVERLVDRIAAAHDGIHVLVNNAGATR